LWFSRAGYEAKIVDDNEESVRDGEIGNLWVRGASAFAEVLADSRIDGAHETRDWVVTATNSFAIRMDTSTTAAARTTC